MAVRNTIRNAPLLDLSSERCAIVSPDDTWRPKLGYNTVLDGIMYPQTSFVRQNSQHAKFAKTAHSHQNMLFGATWGAHIFN